MAAAEIEAARAIGVKRISTEKNLEANRLSTAQNKKPPPRYGIARRPPNRPTLTATPKEGTNINRAATQKAGTTRRMPGFLPVSMKAFCREAKSPTDHNARLSPAAVDATTA
jgi:hypothetical protein